MSSKLKGFLIVSVLTLAILAPLGQGVGSEESRNLSLEEVREQIEANAEHWIADHTSVSDLSKEEFQKLLGLRVPEGYETRLREIQESPPAYGPMDLPSRFDWTDSAGVSPVRSQWCGDCWAQCAVASMESKMRIFDGDTTLLSVQQAIDCNYGGAGCGGGWWGHVYDMYHVVGAVTQTCYPYVGSDGTCTEDTCEFVTTVDGWEEIDTTVVSIKTHLMSNGPIAAGMTVYGDFGYYSGGCYEHSGTSDVNHGVLIVGWDDSQCGGAGAWHIKNSWGTWWGESGYAWLKYGTCSIGAAAAIIHYTPRDPVKLVYDSHVIDDSSGDGDGKPDAGETVTLPVSLTNKRWETATGVSATIITSTPGINIVTASATFPDISAGDTEQSDYPHFSFSVDGSTHCGVRMYFIISMTSDQGVSTDLFDMFVGDAETVFVDDAMEDLGWSLSAGDDDATAGVWKRKNPVGSFLDGALVQPEVNHTPGGGKCFVTSNILRHLPPSSMDVDGGKTTLISPAFDLSDYACANLRYWRWYTNDTGDTTDDNWVVDVSADSGGAWVNLENEATGEADWIPMEFELGEHVLLTDRVMLRFIASDYGAESTVEAAVDDFEIGGCPYWVDTVPASVEVIYPNGGESLTENSEVEIVWTGGDDYGIRQFTVVASYDDGMTYEDTLGTVGGFDTSLVWQVPAGEWTACRIGVEATDRGYNTSFDQSDSPFSIILDVSGIGEGESSRTPDHVMLLGCESNPFTHATHVFFAVPRRMDVSVSVYDARGRLTCEILNATVPAGYHSAMWDGGSSRGVPVSPGMYFVRLEAGGIARTVKVILAR